MPPTDGNSTVMSPGMDGTQSLLAPPKFDVSMDKLAWRKSVRYWAMNIKACAAGGDNRAKGALCAMEMILFGSLPNAKQQALEKFVESGELTLDDGDDYVKQKTAVEKIIGVVAKDCATEGIQRQARLSREAMSCTRGKGESVAAFVERFSVPAHSFLNLTSSDKTSAESQNLAIALVANAKLPGQIYTSVMTALVACAKNRRDVDIVRVALEERRVNTIKTCLSALYDNTTRDKQQTISDAKECVSVIENALSKSKTTSGDEDGSHRVTLADAMSVLEDVNLDVGADSTQNAAPEQHVGAMMAHTDVANRFNNYRGGIEAGGFGQKRRFNRGGYAAVKKVSIDEQQTQGAKPYERYPQRSSNANRDDRKGDGRQRDDRDAGQEGGQTGQEHRGRSNMQRSQYFQ